MAGRGFEFTPSLKSLEPYRDSVVVISNMTRAGTTIGDHAVAPSGWLTGALAKATEAEDVRVGTTIDQILAQQIGQETPLPSLELATEDFTGYVGGCTPLFSCTLHEHDLLGHSDDSSPDGDQSARRLRADVRPRRNSCAAGRAHEGGSAVFSTPSQTTWPISNADSARTTRPVSTTISSTCARSSGESSAPKRRAPQRSRRSTRQSACPIRSKTTPRLMFDLLTVAYQADITRVFTFMIGREASQRTHPQLGQTEPWHTMSHHGNEPEKIVQNAKVNQCTRGAVLAVCPKTGHHSRTVTARCSITRSSSTAAA